MTTLGLGLIILFAILVQIAVFAGIAFFRHWAAYQALRERVGEFAGADLMAPIGQPTTVPQQPPSPVAWEGFRPFRVARRVVEDEGGAVCSFHLEPVDGRPLPPFKPGQFLTFRLQVTDPQGGEPRQIVRCYSLSDRPHPDHYRVSIKRIPAPPGRPELPPGLSSSHFHDHVREGATLEVRAPSGHFHLSDDTAVPVVLVGGGIGITPMLSMLNTLLAEGSTREIRLFYGVRNGAEQIQKGHLRELAERHPNFHLHLCYSHPNPGDREGVDYQHRGHADIERLRLTLPLRRHQFYVCGPRPMMEALVPALEAWGVAAGDIHYEAFGPASVIRKAAPATPPAEPTGTATRITVTFSKSGRTIPWDGAASLLEFAESHGIAVDSGCRAGGCGCCRTRLEAGEVRYAREPDADVEPGSCLLCITTPQTDLTLGA